MDNKEYYNNYNWEKAALSKKIKDKIYLIKYAIPNDVKSILDIGCGDGTISNELNKYFKVIGIDRSINALKFVKSKRINVSADYLPLKNKSIDLVFSSEMVEHLPDDVFDKAIAEMKRVSKKYIFLTFPNNENIKKQLIGCPNCSYEFNKSYHLRTINIEVIKQLFPEYKILTSFEYGMKVRDYNKTLNKLKHKFTPASSWIPYFWTKNQNRLTMCPNCNYEFVIPYKFNIVSYLLDRLNVIISKKRPYQLCILLERK
jgi:ubiquinone/menaquinone biosynthesis C-methylase UbiE